MSADEELEQWKSTWQSLGDKATFATELVDRAAREGRKMKRSAAGEVAGAIVSSGICVWLVVFTKGTIEVAAVTTMILLFNGAWLTHFFTVRAGTFATSGASIDAFVALTRARLSAQLRWSGYAKRWLIVLTALLIPWSIWAFVVHRAAYLAMPWRAAVGFGGWVAILAGVFAFLLWKEKRLEGEIATFEKEVAEAELP